MTGSISWLDAENRTAGDAVPVLIDTGGSGLLAYTFHFDTIPYVAKRSAALGLMVRPIRSGVGSLRGAYTGPMLIQQMQASGASVIGGTLTDLYETPSFATLSVRYDQTLPKGIALYAGVDNAMDFIETTMGKPRYNYNWGPLRGRYVYGGLSYSY
jgi:hypothetical protein